MGDLNFYEMKHVEFDYTYLVIDEAIKRLNRNRNELTDVERSFFIEECEFSIYQNKNNLFQIDDEQGTNLGDICSEEFNDLSEIIERLSDSYLVDYGFLCVQEG
ncbi:hypothetical protein [Aliarcobacter butzleri]|uniref:hypothetical protein n=1 Tax=Aliarcobacter butzleri TaxID=28197 RepID=UPI001269E39B|nr:hypothetical protein [Aliarcobacter butzleri]